MTPINFAYLCNGYFEFRKTMGEDGEVLSPQFFKLLQAHINMCKETPGQYNSKLVAFVGWMESAVDFQAPASKIEGKLNDLFEHVIDPMTVDQQVSENQSTAHDAGYQGWTTRPGIKC